MEYDKEFMKKSALLWTMKAINIFFYQIVTFHFKKEKNVKENFNV